VTAALTAPGSASWWRSGVMTVVAAVPRPSRTSARLTPSMCYIRDTRNTIYPLHGLDAHDLRD